MAIKKVIIIIMLNNKNASNGNLRDQQIPSPVMICRLYSLTA